MTKEEHELMIRMFATQLGMMAGLVNVLHSRGMLRDVELKQLLDMGRSTGPEKSAHLAEVRLLYRMTANILGVEIKLDAT